MSDLVAFYRRTGEPMLISKRHIVSVHPSNAKPRTETVLVCVVGGTMEVQGSFQQTAERLGIDIEVDLHPSRTEGAA